MEMAERQIILSEDTKTNDTIEWLSSMPSNYEIPIIDVYKKRIAAIGELDKESYSKLKKIYFDNYNQIPLWDRKVFIDFLINDAIRLWFKGDKEVLKELFELYKIGMERGLFIHHGQLPEYTYANIVTTSNSVGEFEFTKYFIEEYTKDLAPKIQKDAEIWATGHLFYKTNKFEEAIDLLRLHGFKNNFFTRNGKITLLQSYFDACLKDESYYLFFNDYCEAFKKYIKRVPLMSIERKGAILSLINCCKRVLKICIEKKGSILDVGKLEEEIKLKKEIQGIEWLLKKVMEVKQRLS